MASTSDEERDLETELEVQLHDHKDSLVALTQALSSDPSNSELLSVSEEILQAIKVAEEGLLHLKRVRLLREIDSVLIGAGGDVDRVAKAEEPLDPKNVEYLKDPVYRVGSKCRFRYTDGRWHNGQIIELDGSISAKLSFLTPTSENMLMCKFFRQQRCRFGTSCRLSHGIDVPLSFLKMYVPTVWEKSLVGSSVLATTDCKDGLWREAELESWDDERGVAKVVFGDDGTSVNLSGEAITLSEYAEISDEEESGSSLDGSFPSDEDDDESSQGLGFLDTSALQRGIQKETTIFAKWENHTRGIASKMMANMGYREGMGLGASGQGMVDPIPVRVLPAKQSLDLAVESHKGAESKEGRGSGKKRSRGGKRKRDKKFAALARAAKGEEEMAPDVFTLINTQLARHGETQYGDSVSKQRRDRDSVGKKVDRRSLVAYDYEVKDLRMKVEKLEEMVNRNRREKAVYEAAMRKLTETRKALADAEAVHASASNEIISKEKEKRWLKF